MLKNLKIGQRLYAGFAIVLLLLAAAVATAIWQVSSISALSSRIANQRMPAALAGGALDSDLGSASASLRGFLLTGKDNMKAEFTAAWKQLDQDSATMNAIAPNFTNPDNIKRWSDFKTIIEELRTAQNNVLAIADLANQAPAIELNSKEGAPRMEKLKTILVGELQADGTRSGGMVDSQKQLLEGDTKQVDDATSQLLIAQWAILGLGMLLGGAVAFLTARSIVPALVEMTSAMRELAAGNLTVEVPAKNRGDEIGNMATAVEVFKQDAIKVRALTEAEQGRAADAQIRVTAMNGLVAGLGNVVGAAIDGDFSGRVSIDSKDEDLRSVASAVNDLVTNVDRGVSETGIVLASLAKFDLTHRMTGNYKGAFAKLQGDTNAVAENLTEIVGQLRSTSTSVKSATGEILAGANDLAERTTKQAAAIEETSAAMEQLASTVAANSKRADSASQTAKQVAQTAEDAGLVMTRSNEAMERISTSSAKISNIIGLIDDIAFQTNLLALNASVEAARAGDAGKGFAVVAVEVRRLAQSAASASSEVKVLIEQSANEVSGGSRLVAEAAQKLTSMLAGVRESAATIQGIAAANQEQAGAIGEITTAVREMDEMTQHNAALVEETNAAIEQTEGQANELDRIVSVFVVDNSQSRLPVQQARAAAPATGIRAIKDRVKAAAGSYLSKGNAALKQEWSEF